MNADALNQELRERIAEYASISGKSVSAALNEAVEEWLDTTGNVLLDFAKLKARERREQARGAKVVCISVGRDRYAHLVDDL